MGNLNNKKVIIGLIIIVLVIIGIVCKVRYDNARKYELEQVTSIDYLLLIEEGRCGVINKAGEVVISPIYDDIQIPNPSKPVFICMDNYDENTKEYNITVLNEKSERILYEYVAVKAVSIENSTSSIPYEKSVLQYKENGKWGLIDFNGKKITKPIYDEIIGLTHREGLLKAKKDSKYGVINIKGTTIIKHKYDNIKCDGYYSEDGTYNYAGFIVSNTTSSGYRYGYINYNGKELLKTEYNDITRILDKKDNENAYILAFKNGMGAILKNNKIVLNHEYEDIFYNAENDLLIVQKNAKQGVMNFEGNIIIPIEYSNIMISGNFITAQKNENIEIFDIQGNLQNFKGYISIYKIENTEYYIGITQNDEYKIIDKNGVELTKQIYQDIKNIDGQNFIAQKDNKYGIIDINENVKVDFEYDVMQILSNTQVIQALKLDTTTTDLYNFEIAKIITVTKASIFLESAYIKVVTNNNVQYLDYDGKILKNTDIYDNNNLYAIVQNEKWGFVDKQGNIIIEPKYEMVTEFNEYGFAGIKQDGKWGSIDTQGNIIAEPIYEMTESLPDFINQYYKVDYGYGIPYYTK